MKKLFDVGAWGLGMAAASALAWPAAGLAEENAQLLLMLKQDVGQTASRPLDPALQARLERQVGLKLTWAGTTRTHAQVLTLPAGLDRIAAREAAARLAAMNEVLWSELDTPRSQAPGKASATTPGHEVSSTADANANNIEEIVVKLRDTGAQPPSTDLMALLSRTAGVPLQLEWQTAVGGWLFRLANPVTVSQAATMERALESLSRVMYADPVRGRSAKSLVTTNDPDFPQQWFLQSVSEYPGSANVQAAWELTQGSPEVTVAVLDTGILFRPTHPDLADRLSYLDSAGRRIAGWDMISRVWQARDGNRRDAKPKDQGDWVGTVLTRSHRKICEETTNSTWHGSHVAGIIGAATNNSIGVSGIDWRARLLPVRVLGACGGDVVDIVDGLYWAVGGVGVRGARGNPYPAQVINMSLGGAGECSNMEQESIDYALSRKVVVVVAAGNDSNDAALSSPGNCRGVLTVTAVDKFGNLAPYSNYGAIVGLAAPGGNVGILGNGTDLGLLSPVNGSPKKPLPFMMTYRSYQGTSMSEPVVSGVISLMLAMDTNQQLTPQRIRSILQSTSRTFPAGSRCNAELAGQCGAGIVDAYQAVKAVMDGP